MICWFKALLGVDAWDLAHRDWVLVAFFVSLSTVLSLQCVRKYSSSPGSVKDDTTVRGIWSPLHLREERVPSKEPSWCEHVSSSRECVLAHVSMYLAHVSVCLAYVSMWLACVSVCLAHVCA